MRAEVRPIPFVVQTALWVSSSKRQPAVSSSPSVLSGWMPAWHVSPDCPGPQVGHVVVGVGVEAPEPSSERSVSMPETGAGEPAGPTAKVSMPRSKLFGVVLTTLIDVGPRHKGNGGREGRPGFGGRRGRGIDDLLEPAVHVQVERARGWLQRRARQVVVPQRHHRRTGGGPEDVPGDAGSWFDEEPRVARRALVPGKV